MHGCQPLARITSQLGVQAFQKNRLLAGIGGQSPGRRTCAGRLSAGKLVVGVNQIVLYQGNLGPIEGSYGRDIEAGIGSRLTAAHNPDQDSQKGSYSANGLGVHGLNFYVAPREPGRWPWEGSLQYRRLLLACAMTGEFAAAWLPSVFVPLVGILAPAVAMALLFNVIEARN
jgi:photosystem I subunit 8